MTSTWGDDFKAIIAASVGPSFDPVAAKALQHSTEERSEVSSDSPLPVGHSEDAPETPVAAAWCSLVVDLPFAVVLV